MLYIKESVLNEEDTHNDYPAAAKKNAQMAIDWKEEHGRDEVEAGTPVGWARAHQLAKGENLSTDTVKRMSAFNRHRKNSSIKPELKETPWKDRGYVAWLIWGGDEGVDWAIEKSKEIDAMKESNQLKHIKPLNEAEKYITDKFKVGDKIKTNFGEWEVIETDYAPNKSFMAPFIFKGKDMERVNIPNPPKTNKKAVGYKVTDGDKYPIIGFLYQYKDITKLATVGVDESVVNEYSGDGTNKISDDKLMNLIPKMPKGYVGKNTRTGEYTISTPDGEDIVLTQSKDKKNWSYEPSNIALKILDESVTEAESNFETLLATSEDESIGRKIRLGGKRDPGQEVWQKVDRKFWMNLKTKKKLDLNKWAKHADEFHMADKDLQFESKVDEASRRKVHKAAKQGSYPAVIVVVQDGEVIHQEPVSTPDVAPATFNVMQERYPKAVLHLEDNTGKRLFSESLVNEAKAYKLKASEFGADTHSAAYNVKGEPTWRVHSTYAIDQVSGENNPEERDVVFFEAMPINNDIYIKIGGINNLKRTNGATVGNNFGTTIDEWKKDPNGIAKEASEFLTDATHLKWINKKARSEGQVIKWALKDDYSSVIEDLVNKSLGLTEAKMPNKFIGNDEIVYLKTKETSRGAHYNLYYKGHDIDLGGQSFGSEKELEDFAGNYILSNQWYNKLKHEDSIPLPESVVNEWGSSDQATFNKSMHKEMGSPRKMPSPFDDKLRDVAADNVDHYWDDWDEYDTDRDGLIDNAVRGYLRAFFNKDFEMMQKMFASKSVVTEGNFSPLGYAKRVITGEITLKDAMKEAGISFKNISKLIKEIDKGFDLDAAIAENQKLKYIKPFRLSESVGGYDYKTWIKNNGKIKYPKWITVTRKEIVKKGLMDSVYDSESQNMSIWAKSLGQNLFTIIADTKKREKEFGELGAKFMDQYYNDIMGYTAISWEAATICLELIGNIDDRIANGEEVEPAHYMAKEYFHNFGMDTKRSRLFDGVVKKLGAYMAENKLDSMEFMNR